MTKPSIGFLGLGLMGSAMVECLQANDYSVTVLANKNRTHVDAAISRGATEAKSAKEVAESSEIIMLCMDTSASVEGRMYGMDGIISGLNPGAVVIDFGTSLPGSTRRIGADVDKAGGAYLDAPLGRTPAHAQRGELNIMCAGNMDAYNKVKPVLEDLGENVFHLGALGSGHTVKLINNFFGMTVATAMSEAFAMADVAGVDRQQVYDVMSAGPLHSGMMDFVKANAVDGDPSMLAFAIKNARKDVGYYASMADEAGVPSLISPGTKQALSLAVSAGYGDQMVSEMVDYLAKLYSEN